MIEVRTKDRIFVAVALPLALLGCYLHFVRGPLATSRTALAAERARLPDPDMFPQERRALSARVDAAARELAAARAEPPPELTVRGRPADSEGVRLQAVFDALQRGGVRVVRAEPVEAAGRAADVLRATGVRPEPAARRVVLEADYPALVGALLACEAGRLAVVAGALSLASGETTCRWEVTLWF